MRLLIVVPDQDRITGNWVTAHRFRQGLAARGHQVALCPAGPGLAEVLAAGPRPDLALLLHALRSGRPWLEQPATGGIPFAVLLTGTDVNEGLDRPVEKPVIEDVLARAGAVITQNPLTETTLRAARPDLVGRLRLLPPGILLGAAPFPLRSRLGLAPGERLLLTPGGLRPVKGMLGLLGLLDPLAAGAPPFRAVFCGPTLDPRYAGRFRAALARRPWALHLGALPPEAMPAALRETDLVLSNSRSEGLPNALVEAAALGRPILARRIPGNAAVVEEGVNGLLYGDPAEFRALLRKLLERPERLAALSRPQPERYAPNREAARLEDIFREVLAARE